MWQTLQRNNTIRLNAMLQPDYTAAAVVRPIPDYLSYAGLDTTGLSNNETRACRQLHWQTFHDVTRVKKYIWSRLTIVYLSLSIGDGHCTKSNGS